ncbi:N-acetylmuramoyl-L-alanine amidase [Parapedobacter deserti]|uniref:N-acetylmuramoyl-L-alanine amidase n=1 Tax=Parapedobacter deserti TaxID=1912957 RepID=A0ABV7JQ34_9SPHI
MLKISSPDKDSSTVFEPLVYFKGLTDPASVLFVNGDALRVYSTGAFAASVPLQEGLNELHVMHIAGRDTLRKRMVVVYEKPRPPQPTQGFAIDQVRVFPGGALWLMPGDLLQVEMKATPGNEAFFYKDIPLFEADTAGTGVAGIYRGEYTVRSSDTFNNEPILFRLRDRTTGTVVVAESNEQITVLSQPHSLTALTVGHQTPLYYGLGTGRLGGAKMGYLDRSVKLEVTGKMSNMYRVRLAEQVQAYVPENQLSLQKGVHFRPYSLTESWSVYSDSADDFVRIGLNERLPYTATVQHDPTRIVIDIYGAVSNSNWITQKEGLMAIRNVWYEQASKDIFRVYIELKDKQLWGYDVGYHGRQLVIRVKPSPASHSLRRLRVAVDAGHGGSNLGAKGMTGVLEKALNLSMALKLRAALEEAGATVIMTRRDDRLVGNTNRLAMLREADPDILVSIHCNASRNPLVQGTSTYYRHQAYRPLSQYIHSEMLKLDMEDFGNVGGFNFILNAPTEFPSALVEVAFLSNPADEERLLDTGFQEAVAKSIVAGLRRFVREAAE